MASSFLDRFRQLEIPEEKRRVDWSFLDQSLALPEPLPLADRPLVVLMNGRLLEPADEAPAGDSIVFYRQPLALVERGTAAAVEADWLVAHKDELARQAKVFVDSIPTEVVRLRADEGLEILQLNSPKTRLLDGERLLRIHGKLYNLVTLHDYARIFEKAIEPTAFRALQALPPTCTPVEMLAQIAELLPQIHKKARSPLRNKMECARLVVGGITLLPVYREPAAALFDAWRRLLERQIKVDVLSHHAAR